MQAASGVLSVTGSNCNLPLISGSTGITGAPNNYFAYNNNGVLGFAPSTNSPNPIDTLTFGPLSKAGTTAIYAAGAGYAINDTITIATTGGSCSITPVFTVTGRSGGAITSISLTTAGSCAAIPNNNPTVQGSTSGSGWASFVISWMAIAQTYTPTSSMKVAKIARSAPARAGKAAR